MHIESNVMLHGLPSLLLGAPSRMTQWFVVERITVRAGQPLFINTTIDN
jgi:hypothetical protein